jgi:hypothetical protein
MDLDEAQLQAVRSAFQVRNLEACKRGLPACDPSLLNGPEMAAVTAAYQQRHNGPRNRESKP